MGRGRTRLMGKAGVRWHRTIRNGGSMTGGLMGKAGVRWHHTIRDGEVERGTAPGDAGED